MRYIVSILIFVVLATVSCKDLKEQQLDAYVGDKETKIVYKNVSKKAKEIPEDRKVGFRSQAEAIDQGYTPENMAGDAGTLSPEE